ncbi:exonuclease domain-containing protein [Patescibacteria group bacterium]
MKHVYPKTIITLDLETTGLDPEKGRILEVAAVKFRAGKEIDTFQTLVNPKQKIPFIVTDITGITDEDVVGAPNIEDVIPELTEFVGSAPIVGHNIMFDLHFLKKAHFEAKGQVFDTWRLSTFIYRDMKSHSLENIARNLKLKIDTTHRAYDDAALAGRLFYRATDDISKTYTKKNLEEIATFVRNRDWSLEDAFLTIIENTSAEGEEIKEKKEEKSLAEGFDSVPEAFEALKGLKADFQKKESQEEIAQAIINDLEKSDQSIYEIMPDSGRLLAALVAGSVFVAKHKSPVVFATTQRQINLPTFVQDIEGLKKLFGSLKLEVFKSPDNYLCQASFEMFKNRQDLTEPEVDLVVKILLWLSQTRTGDMDELSLMYEQRDMARELVQEDCADNHPKCYACKAIDQISNADVIALDHETLLRWLSRSVDMKRFKHIIIDRAELLEESATRTLSQTISQPVYAEMMDKISRPHPGIGFVQRVMNEKVSKETKQAATALEESAEDALNSSTLFFGVLGMAIRNLGSVPDDSPYDVQLVLDEHIWDELEGKKIVQSYASFKNRVEALNGSIEKLSKLLSEEKVKALSTEADIVFQKNLSYLNGMEDIFIKKEKRWMRWAVVGREKEFYLKKAPLEVAPFLQKTFWKGRKVVAFSRNATVRGSSKFLSDQIGFEDASLQFFGRRDYSETVLFTRVSEMPDIASQKFLQHAGNLVIEVSNKTKRNIIVAVPSFTSCKTYYEKIKPELEKIGYDVFAQGISGGMNKMTEKLLDAHRTALIATPRFLTDMETPGEKIIFLMKIPFPLYGDPSHILRQKEVPNGFMDYTLPLAIQNIRHLFFRLIKDDGEKKSFIVLDKRLVASGYANEVVDSFPGTNDEVVPEAKVVENIEKWFKQ